MQPFGYNINRSNKQLDKDNKISTPDCDNNKKLSNKDEFEYYV